LKYPHFSELHNRLLNTKNAVRDRTDRLNELLPLVEDVPFEQKEFFEDDIKLFLDRLRRHHEVWSSVLKASQERKVPRMRRVK